MFAPPMQVPPVDSIVIVRSCGVTVCGCSGDPEEVARLLDVPQIQGSAERRLWAGLRRPFAAIQVAPAASCRNKFLLGHHDRTGHFGRLSL